MIEHRTIGNLVWVDLTDPSTEEALEIIDSLAIDMPVNRLLGSKMLSHFERHHNYSYCVLRFPRLRLDDNSRHRTSFEIEIIVTDQQLVTIHTIPLFEIDSIEEKIQTKKFDTHVFDSFLTMFLLEFYSTSRDQLFRITERLEFIELSIFENYSTEIIEQLSEVGRMIIDTNRSLGTHSNVLANFRDAHFNSDERVRVRFDEVIESYAEISNILETNRNILVELRHTHGALLTQKTNAVLITLTVISFVLLPLSFAVDVSWIVFRQELGEYMLPLIGVVFTTILLLVYKFHKMKWV